MLRAFKVTFEASNEVYDTLYYNVPHVQQILRYLGDTVGIPPKFSSLTIEVIHIEELKDDNLSDG
ncbi:hypothetical protein LCGC14_1811730 [marine sediment metagenome]|uniref:Uncharacterized protein n=2 Tax=marine sediment metagenome TaxID=412755 RepID=A0A0F9J181_9ZZZZ